MAGPKSKKGKEKKGTTNVDKIQNIETLTPEIHKLLTAKSLLTSVEDGVVLQSLIAVEKYCNQADNNQLNFMCENEFSQLLFNLIPRHKHICRFSLKILITLQRACPVFETVIKEPTDIEIMKTAFLQHDDEIILEFLTYILKNVCKTEEFRQVITNDQVMKKLNNTIIHTLNPDLQFNSLEVLYEIVLCTLGPNFVDYIMPELLVCLLKNPLIEIQDIALRVLAAVTQWNSDALLEKLRAVKMVQMLFNLLQSEEWRNEQNIALSILVHCIGKDNKEIEALEFLKLLQAASSDTANDGFILAVVAIINEYAKIEFSRQVLFDYKIHELLIKFLERECDMIKVLTCETLSNLILNNCLAQTIIHKNLIHPLTRLLAREDLPWNPYRESPLKIIYQLMFTGTNLPILLYKCNTLKPLREALKNKDNITKSNYERLLEIYQNLFFNKSIRKYILNEEVYPYLLQLLTETEEVDISKKMLHLLQDTIIMQRCRVWFCKYGGLEVIMSLIKNQHTEIAEEITTFLEECLNYEEIALAFLHAGIIDYIPYLPKYQQQPLLGRDLVENFYNFDLSMKFHKLDHLLYTDSTENGFYVFLLKQTEFCDLEDYPTVLSPALTVIRVNFNTIGMQRNSVEPPVFVKRKRKAEEAEEVDSTTSKRSNSAESILSVTSECIKELLPPDPPASDFYDFYLHRCLRKATLLVDNAVTLEDKIVLLAKFVARQMSGYIDVNKAPPSSVDCKLHYTALKKRLNSNIIPLGLIRFGGFTERAILYKVLADRLNILVDLRRKHPYAWCEVPMFTMDPQGECVIERFILDLMYKVGKLMPRDRWDALAYINGKSIHSVTDFGTEDDRLKPIDGEECPCPTQNVRVFLK